MATLGENLARGHKGLAPLRYNEATRSRRRGVSTEERAETPAEAR